MSRSTQALDLDKKQIQDFTRFNQNTHNAAVTNSVGMALVSLYDYYFPGADKKLDEKEQAKQAEAQIDQAFEECIGQLKATSIDFKTGAVDLEKTAAIDYIISVTKQPLSILDKVTLSHLKDKNSKDLFNANNFIKEDRMFPLKTVLVLIWKAINDDARYAHNYSFSTPEENLKAAKADRGERIKSVFNCLINIKNETVCHHGNRNELTFLLNKTYVGIDLIEIVSSTVKAIFNDEINRLFSEKYNDAKAQDKRLVLGKLYQWMQGEEGAAHEIVKYLDPNNKIVDKIKLLFVNNGCDPNDTNIGLNKVIKDTLDYALYFTCDPKKDKALDKINKIFNFIDDPKQPDRNAALAVIKKWIIDKYELNSSEDNKKVNTFYFLFTAHATLSNALPLLKLTGLMQDEFTTLLEECNSAFLAIKKPTDLKDQKGSDAFPVLTSKLVETANKMLEVEKKAKSATFVDKIESFFALWKQEKTEAEAVNEATPQFSALYSLLLSDVFKSKVTLTDANLKEYFKESKDHKGSVELTPYIINRLFLHAILTSSSWSEDFSREIKRVIAFVKGSFNQTAVNFIAMSLSKDSYPPDLIQQLEYMSSKYSVESKDEKAVAIEKPNNLLVLTPGECKSALDWRSVLIYLDESVKERVYTQQAQLINELLFRSAVSQGEGVPSEWFQYFFKFVVPKSQRLSFFKKFEGYFYQIVNNKDNLLAILGALAEEHRGSFLIHFPVGRLYTDVVGVRGNDNVLIEIANLLPVIERAKFVKEAIWYLQMRWEISSSIHASSLILLVQSLHYSDRILRVKELIAFDPANREVESTLPMYLKMLDGQADPNVDNKKQELDKLEVLEEFLKKKPLRNRHELKTILQFFSNEGKLVILNKFGRGLTGSFINKNPDNLSAKFYLDLLLTLFKWDKRAPSLRTLDLSSIKLKLDTKENFTTYLRAIDPQTLLEHICNPKDLAAMLPFVSEKNKYQIIDNYIKEKGFRYFLGKKDENIQEYYVKGEYAPIDEKAQKAEAEALKSEHIDLRNSSLEGMLQVIEPMPLKYKRKIYTDVIVKQLETFNDLKNLLNYSKQVQDLKRANPNIDEKHIVNYDFGFSDVLPQDSSATDSKLDVKQVQQLGHIDVDNKAASSSTFIDIFLEDSMQKAVELITDWNSLILVLKLLNRKQQIKLTNCLFVNINSYDNLKWSKSFPAIYCVELMLSGEPSNLKCIDKMYRLNHQHLRYLHDQASNEYKKYFSDVYDYLTFKSALNDRKHLDLLNKHKDRPFLSCLITRHLLVFDIKYILKDETETAYSRLDKLRIFFETPIKDLYQSFPFLNKIVCTPGIYLEYSQSQKIGVFSKTTDEVFVVAIKNILDEFNQYLKNVGIERVTPLNKDEKSMPGKKV